MDAHGKLFFGKYRPDATNRERSFVVEPSSFYNRYLIPAIHKSEKTPKKRKNTQLNDISHNSKLEQLRFGLINFCEGNRKLIVIPLEEEGETKRYLCIYILKWNELDTQRLKIFKGSILESMGIPWSVRTHKTIKARSFVCNHQWCKWTKSENFIPFLDPECNWNINDSAVWVRPSSVFCWTSKYRFP